MSEGYLRFVTTIAISCCLAPGCIDDTKTEDPARETGYLRCVVGTVDCGERLRCLASEGDWICVDPPTCGELTCECAGELACGEEVCRKAGDELICGAAEDANQPDLVVLPDATVILDEGPPDQGFSPDISLVQTCTDEQIAAEGAECDLDLETNPDASCQLCSPNVECCRHFLGCFGGSWQTIEAGPCEDASPPLDEPCLISFGDGGEDSESTCNIPLDHPFPCGQLARCVCRAMVGELGNVAVEQCAHSILIPRGAITLADFCGQAENTIGSLVDNPVWADGDIDIESSEVCDTLSVLTRPPAGPDIWLCSETPQDLITVDQIVVEGDGLSVTATYSGCEDHYVGVCWDGTFTDSDPQAAGLMFYHRDPGDPCDDVQNFSLTYDLRNIRDAWLFRQRQSRGSLLLRWLFPTGIADTLYEF